MRDRDAIEKMSVGSEWRAARFPHYTEYKLGTRLDAGPKIDVWWNLDGEAESATYYDGDGEPVETVEKNVMGWLAHQLR